VDGHSLSDSEFFVKIYVIYLNFDLGIKISISGDNLDFNDIVHVSVLHSC
jgi:hypothetical protein